jgi:hypothetical protein
MLWGSQKARDLQRDQQVLVHSIVTSRSGGVGEYKVRGRAVPHDHASLQRHYAEAVSERLGWRPIPGRFHLFSVDISDVTFIRYEGATGISTSPAGLPVKSSSDAAHPRLVSGRPSRSQTCLGAPDLQALSQSLFAIGGNSRQLDDDPVQGSCPSW